MAWVSQGKVLRTLFVSSLVFATVFACSKKDEAPGDGDGDGDESGGSAGDGDGDSGGAPSGGSGNDSGGMSMGGGGAGGCESDLPIITQAPFQLSDTGLYDDIEAKDVAHHMMEFAPRFTLWSDGAEKTRWLYLPSCSPQIDTSDMDSWVFPVGTYAFKQFVVDGVLVETRMIHRYGPGSQDWLYALYRWNEEETEAILLPMGGTFVRDEAPDYVIPSVDAGDCARCHGPNAPGQAEIGTGLPERLLGLNAIDLSHSGPGLTITELSEYGHLSVPVTAGFDVPGTEVEVEALGYLHANCGFCHNDTPRTQVLQTPYALRLKTDQELVETGAYVTAVNQPVTNFVSQEPAVENKCTHRIYGTNTDLSCIHERMSARGTSVQMPPLDSNRPDDEGLAAIDAWINTLDAPDLGGAGGGN